MKPVYAPRNNHPERAGANAREFPQLRLRATLCLLMSALYMSASPLEIRPSHPDGVYAPGDHVAWHIRLTESAPDTTASYTVLNNGGSAVLSGEVALGTGEATLSLPPEMAIEPAAWLLRVRLESNQTGSIEALGGAVVNPRAIRPMAPKPDDFDAFWDDTMRAQRAMPFNLEIESLESGRSDVLLQRFSLDALDGSRAHAQLARPREGFRFPALVILQWAGVYGLDRETVLAKAAEGWLAMNVMPHDLPLYEPPATYEALRNGALRDFGTIGSEERSESYLHGILLRAARAVDYLASRPDWDGKILIATGTSMGGFQAIAMAALNPRVTGVAANVPAACELSAALYGRGAPWPYWLGKDTDPQTRERRQHAAQYLDGVHFASRVRVPVLLSAGLLDTSCPPSGILAMASQLQGPVRLVIMPLSPHQDPHHAYHAAAASFFKPLSVPHCP